MSGVDEPQMEERALLWSITSGILMILSIMIAITCLLVRYNHHGQHQAYAYGASRNRTDRGKSGGTRTQDEDYLDPRIDIRGSSRPYIPGMPGKRPLTPSSSPLDSTSNSISEHIYDVPACQIYENASETSSSGTPVSSVESLTSHN